LYTAVTRGKKLVVVIAERKALAMAVRNRKAKKRVTRLAERLAGFETTLGLATFAETSVSLPS
jgi:ATP-dependent exoDNAse (exonuclease V) alpha subunit